MLLNIEKKRIGADIVVLEMNGRITLGRECQQVEWSVEELVKSGEKKMIFDIAKLQTIDSTGVGILVMCSAKLKKAGGELRLAGAQGFVENILKLTKVEMILPLYPTVDAAAQNFTLEGAAAQSA